MPSVSNTPRIGPPAVMPVPPPGPRTPRHDARPRRRPAQINPARAMTAGDIVMQRAAFAQRNARQVALRRFGGLADRLGNFARLAVAESDPALLIADHDQRRKAEALAALDHLRHTIDVDELVDEFAVALFPAAPVAATAFAFTCHGVFQSLRGSPVQDLSSLEDLRLCPCVRSIAKP